MEQANLSSHRQKKKSLSSVQIWSDITLVSGKHYELTLDVEAKKDGDISAVYNMGVAPYKYYSSQIPIDIEKGTSQIKQNFSVRKGKIIGPTVIRFYLGKFNGSLKISNVKIRTIEKMKKIERKIGFADYKPPYTRLKRNPLEKQLPGTVNFWKDDRLNVPDYAACRNMLSNPSFEAGLRYYTFSPAIGTYQPGYEDKYSIDNNVSKFGKSSLKIKTERPIRAFDNIRSFAYPVIKGQTYTLSFYSKATKNNIELTVTHTSDHGFSKTKRPPLKNLIVLSNEWTRYSTTFKSNSTGYGFNFSITKNVKGEAVWIDGVQLEKGEKITEFTAKPITAILTTSDNANFLTPDQKINGKLIIKTTKPNRKGTVSVTVKDFLYNEINIGKFNFKTNSESSTEIKLPLDKFYSGKKGVFVVRTETSLDEGKKIIDYFRFSIMNNLQGTHRNKDIFSYHQLVIPNHEAGLKRWKDIGLGSTNYFYYNFHNKLLFDLLEKYNIEDTAAQQRNHWGGGAKLNHYRLKPVGLGSFVSCGLKSFAHERTNTAPTLPIRKQKVNPSIPARGTTPNYRQHKKHDNHN